MKGEYLQIRISKEEKERIRLEAKRAGKGISEWVLDQIVPKESEQFQERVKRIAQAEPQERPFAYAELSDFLSSLRGSGAFSAAVRFSPPSELSEVDRNLIAAFVERRAQMCGFEPPEWVREVAPLKLPWFATPLLSLRLYLLKNAPVVFRRRNLFVDASVGDRK